MSARVIKQITVLPGPPPGQRVPLPPLPRVVLPPVGGLKPISKFMNADDFLNRVLDHNNQALKIDGFDASIIGLAVRKGRPTVLIYSVAKMLDSIEKQLSNDRRAAEQWFDEHVFRDPDLLALHAPILMYES